MDKIKLISIFILFINIIFVSSRKIEDNRNNIFLPQTIKKNNQYRGNDFNLFTQNDRPLDNDVDDDVDDDVDNIVDDNVDDNDVDDIVDDIIDDNNFETNTDDNEDYNDNVDDNNFETNTDDNVDDYNEDYTDETDETDETEKDDNIDTEFDKDPIIFNKDSKDDKYGEKFDQNTKLNKDDKYGEKFDQNTKLNKDDKYGEKFGEKYNQDDKSSNYEILKNLDEKCSLNNKYSCIMLYKKALEQLHNINNSYDNVQIHDIISSLVYLIRSNIDINDDSIMIIINLLNKIIKSPINQQEIDLYNRMLFHVIEILYRMNHQHEHYQLFQQCVFNFVNKFLVNFHHNIDLLNTVIDVYKVLYHQTNDEKFLTNARYILKNYKQYPYICKNIDRNMYIYCNIRYNPINIYRNKIFVDTETLDQKKLSDEFYKFILSNQIQLYLFQDDITYKAIVRKDIPNKLFYYNPYEYDNKNKKLYINMSLMDSNMEKSIIDMINYKPDYILRNKYYISPDNKLNECIPDIYTGICINKS